MSTTPHPGDLFVVSAPSGAGKTSLIRRLLVDGPGGHGGLHYSVSHTTRPCRRGEIEGRDYHFVDPATFRRMVEEGRFLEWAEVHGNLYGTSADEVLPYLEQGLDVLMDLDIQGAEQLIRRFPEAQSVFVLPPTYADLERRLRRRGLDDVGSVARRLSVSLSEIRSYTAYKYVIINDDLERAAGSLAAIILDKRHRLARARRRAERIIEDFEAVAANSDQSE